MKQDVTQILRLSQVPVASRALAIEKDIMILDNIDQKMPSGLDSRIREGLPTREVQPEGYDYPYRVAFHTIVFVERGKISCRLNLSDYVLEGGSIFLTPSGVILDGLSMDAGTRFVFVAYTDGSHLASLTTSSAKIIRAATLSPLYLPVSGDRMDRYLQLLRVVLHVAEGGPDYRFKKDIIDGFTDVISGGIARIVMEHGPRPRSAGRNQLLLRRFVREVQRHCREQRSLSFYADRLCMSPKYLSRIIGETAGRGAAQIIRDNVILEAKVLLRGGQYNVQQVSNLLGFPNSSFFGRYFKEATGMTPRQFARQG